MGEMSHVDVVGAVLVVELAAECISLDEERVGSAIERHHALRPGSQYEHFTAHGQGSGATYHAEVLRFDLDGHTTHAVEAFVVCVPMSKQVVLRHPRADGTSLLLAATKIEPREKFDVHEIVGAVDCDGLAVAEGDVKRLVVEGANFASGQARQLHGAVECVEGRGAAQRENSLRK